MMLRGFTSPREYAQFLERDRDEAEALYRDVLINVTSFFRDPEMFEDLKREVFPAIVNGRPDGPPIRVWVPGCSTGQEAYSIAMALLEFLDTAKTKRSHPDFCDRPRRPDIPRQGAGRTLPGEHRSGSQSGAAAPVLRQGGSSLPDSEERSRSLRLRAAERDGRSAVFARRSGDLPQRPDLHVAAAAGTAAARVPLRPESGRLSRPRPGRNGRLVRRPVRPHQSRAQDLSQEGDGEPPAADLHGRRVARRHDREAPRHRQSATRRSSA